MRSVKVQVTPHTDIGDSMMAETDDMIYCTRQYYDYDVIL